MWKYWHRKWRRQRNQALIDEIYQEADRLLKKVDGALASKASTPQRKEKK